MTDLLLGTMKSLDPLEVAADGSAITMPVTCYAPPNVPAVDDRVLYQVVDGRVVVLANITTPFRIITGVESLVVVTGNVGITNTVSFPSGFFSIAPRIFLTRNAGIVNTTFQATASGSSTSGFNLNYSAATPGTHNVWWEAVQQ